MEETTIASESAQEATEDAAAESQTFDADYVKALRAEAAKYRTEAKANAEAAARLREIEDTQKTEAQRVTEELQEVTRRAEEAELRALRIEVAAEKGLTPAQAKRLVGATKEELEADADEILTDFGGKPLVTAQNTGAGAVSQNRDSDDPNTWLRRAVTSAERRP